MGGENLGNNECTTVEIEAARFNDRLAPEHEQYWSELMEALNTATAEYGQQGERAKILFDIWRDEKFPWVYRDRAMLELDRSYYAFQGETGIYLPLWDNIVRACCFTEEDRVRRDVWYLDALRYYLGLS